MAASPRSPVTPGSSPSMRAAPTSPTLQSTESTEEVHEKLRSLHCDELVQISPPTVLGTFYSWIKSYIKFLWMIWGHVITLGLDECTDSFEWTLVFAIMTTTLLIPMLFFCMFFSLPFIQPFAFRLYAYAVTTPMYESWWNGDKRALIASRAALSKPVESRNSRLGPRNNNRHFDLDIARILLQFSGLVYEHDSSAVRKALAIVKNATPFDIFGALRGRGRVGLDKFIGADPAALARAALTGEKLVERPSSLGREQLLDESPLSTRKPGTKLEPQVGSTKPASHGNTNAHVEPGPGDSTIRAHLQSSEIEYEPVSELNGVGSAFAALFWHPREPWVVVAFKGTSPTEFDEWVTDLTFTREDMGTWIPGFGKVHSGFKARMFPDEARIPHSLRDHFKRHAMQLRDWWVGEKSTKQQLPVRTPYDTIREGIQIVADHLTRNTGIHSINVYFTGHSLGCATASLAYARAVAKQNTDFKSNVRIRDAYMFAAPVIGDVKTRDTFNLMMGSGLPRSMWRISNGPDVIAGLLPEMGDRVPLRIDQESPLAFAHLGLEIKMIPEGPDGRGKARVDAVVAPHRPTSEPVHIVQHEHFGPEEEEHGRMTNDRDSGVFSDNTSEQSYDGRVRIADSGTFKLAIVKQIPLVGTVLWWGVSHIILSLSMPRQLPRVGVMPVQAHALAAIDPELRNIPVQFVRQRVCTMSKEILEVLATCVPTTPLTNPLPRTLDCTVLHPNPEPSMLPTHYLVVYNPRTPDQPGKLFPAHSLVLATQCAALPSFGSTTRELRDDNTFTAPLLGLALPAPNHFEPLFLFLHDHSANALLASLLPLPQAAFGRISLETDGITERLTHALSDWLSFRTLLSTLKTVHGVWANAVALHVDNDRLWKIIDFAWRVLVAAVERSAGPNACSALDSFSQDERDADAVERELDGALPYEA
ncbi:unnamed protein product [Rhizoctonia solani]|uniref:Fungal lipase-type domain-containing protein n=1 Tax=Rhizoctonia solani TaxID=456999 RepID=A0A8H3AQQ4_9AGAM|nr:unnamed protein product [Rhizoctonia solani]